jgi:hypothetical protein
MKALKATLLLAVVLAIGSGSAFSRGGHGGHGHSGGSHFSGGHAGGFHSRARIGVFVGAPLFAYGYYPFYDYGYQPIYSAPAASEYIEKEPAGRSPSDYWYYCPGSAAYYPYVKECPQGWQTVEPLSPPAS